MAAAFCPHIVGDSDCCLMQKASAHPRDCVIESGMSIHDQREHAHMSKMDMQDVPMNMAGMQMDDAAASEPKSGRELLSSFTLPGAPNKELAREVITQPNERCSHCMMPSQSGANFPVRIARRNNPSYQIVAADAATAMLKSAPSSLTFLELHDHGPPGSSPPLYVLVSAFRI